MTRRTDLMVAAATERLNRIIGQQARRAREGLQRRANDERAAVDRLWPAPRLDQTAEIYWRFIREGSIGAAKMAAVNRVWG